MPKDVKHGVSSRVRSSGTSTFVKLVSSNLLHIQNAAPVMLRLLPCAGVADPVVLKNSNLSLGSQAVN